MRIEDTIRYADASPDRVFAMLVTPKFQELKCAATGALSYDVDVTSTGDQTVVTCRRSMPTDGLPEFARAMVRDGIELIETLAWSPLGPDGTTSAQVTVEFVGQPLSMAGQLTMAPDGDETVCSFLAELTARVPLFGGRIEKATAPVIYKALATEQSLGQTWLGEHP